MVVPLFLLFLLLLLRFLLFFSSHEERERKVGRVLLDRQSSFVCPTPSLRFILAPCSTGSGGPRDEDIPRAHFAKFPKFATSRSRANSLISPRVISILSRNSSLERDGTSAPPVHRVRHLPSTSYFFMLRLSSRSKAALYFTLCGVMVYSLLRLSLSSLLSASFH